MKSKLLPCPFCGSTRLVVAASQDFPQDKSVCCMDCHASGPINTRGGSASKLWNVRFANKSKESK